ncbi:hypothetical protein ACFPVX_10530 [Cohnella faecalis]|uniref:hypothetical protein n=1 Tax=Cohnella faecalis TaxID=2315694 RepID=UPI0018F6A481|nr:hypothetical protein [Cohnella faecalis]
MNTFIPFYPGITIRQALESTGLVRFGPGGFITSIGGIQVGLLSNVNVRVFYNGRIIPQTLLGAPAQPGSTIGLELYYSNLPLPTPF